MNSGNILAKQQYRTGGRSLRDDNENENRFLAICHLHICYFQGTVTEAAPQQRVMKKKGGDTPHAPRPAALFSRELWARTII
jgi:hypothetical protein